MLGKKIKLFQLFGLTINIDASWFIIVALLTRSVRKPDVSI